MPLCNVGGPSLFGGTLDCTLWIGSSTCLPATSDASRVDAVVFSDLDQSVSVRDADASAVNVPQFTKGTLEDILDGSWF